MERETEVRRMGYQQKKIRVKTERATRLGRRTKEEWDQTGSPEIPHRGETSEIPGREREGVWGKEREGVWGKERERERESE